VYEWIRHPGVSIIFLSLAMNLLVLPLYKRADAMQEHARDIEAKLAPGIAHIKKTFSGSERMMMLQTYYRQNDYSPVNALKGSISLLLEIPFFMAAYQFLSNLETLKGASFGPVADLSLPDGLLAIGTVTINVLPVLMTLINFISATIYLKGFPLKTKVQLYGIALVFLVLLYGSPAGLVFYWTLNNVFSLVKNILYRVRETKKQPKSCAYDKKLFAAGTGFLALFIGLLIPSNYISSSPQEFIDTDLSFSPLWFILSAFLLAAGMFILWFGVFYRLAGDRGKAVFERVVLALCGIAVFEYMYFGSRFGVVSPLLKYQNGMLFDVKEGIISVAGALIIAAVLILVLKKFEKIPRTVLLAASLAVLIMSALNISSTASALKEINISGRDDAPHFSLSRNGKNVVVLFLDRAMGEYIPYIMQEKPELKETYDGFTYYSNVISFGGHTNMGAPALMGGYEYTPVELNRRSSESLKDKHNESLKVMPVMFLDSGFNVTVCDAPYANYKWIPDMSIYDDYPEIATYITDGYFTDPVKKQRMIDRNMRNFFCFSLMKCMPLPVQLALYDGGNYLMASSGSVNQKIFNKSRAEGISEAFMEPYDVLEHLGTMTNISDSSENNYLFFYNDAPHEPMMLQEPEYLPSEHVDNTDYDRTHSGRFTDGDHSARMNTSLKMMHYETNMAVLMKIGEWLDLLRENGVYDNTRIIIVADHGYYLYQNEQLHHYKAGYHDIDIGNYFPLLMVKDFGSTGFVMSDEFMTNADVPSIAAKDVIADPVNPFTKKPLDSSEKFAHDQFIMTSKDWSVNTNNGNTFNPSSWAVVTNNIWDREDWVFIDKKLVLNEHSLPGEER